MVKVRRVISAIGVIRITRMIGVSRVIRVIRVVKGEQEKSQTLRKKV